MVDCLLCSDAVCWVAGRASSLQESEQWGAGVVISLERGVGLAFEPSVWCHCHSLSLASVKSRLVYLSGTGCPG